MKTIQFVTDFFGAYRKLPMATAFVVCVVTVWTILSNNFGTKNFVVRNIAIQKNRSAIPHGVLFDRKVASLKPFYDLLPHTYKLQPQFAVNIPNPNFDTLEIGQAFNLTWQVSGLHLATGLHYTWIIPEGIIAEGPSEGALDLNNEGKFNMETSFRNMTNRNMRIHLKIWSADRTQVQSAQFNTQWQNVLDEQRRALNELQELHIKELTKGL